MDGYLKVRGKTKDMKIEENERFTLWVDPEDSSPSLIGLCAPSEININSWEAEVMDNEIKIRYYLDE